VLEERQLDHLALLASFAAMAIDNASLHGRTRMMALTDALTGLYNNRYFMQMFPHELIRARRYMKPLSLIMIDVDNFKKLNDTYGHPKGDQVLANLGKILAGSLRAADLSFRYGGEEFAVILPETRLDGAFMVAETLREKIFKGVTPLLGQNSDHLVTVSLGVSGFPGDGSTTDHLLSHADACLYKAKHQGKNMVYWESSFAAVKS
jgi:diguanylate cyclase (GGDEF)-like protein